MGILNHLTLYVVVFHIISRGPTCFCQSIDQSLQTRVNPHTLTHIHTVDLLFYSHVPTSLYPIITSCVLLVYDELKRVNNNPTMRVQLNLNPLETSLLRSEVTGQIRLILKIRIFHDNTNIFRLISIGCLDLTSDQSRGPINKK